MGTGKEQTSKQKADPARLKPNRAFKLYTRLQNVPVLS